jgi:hypothetical protein
MRTRIIWYGLLAACLLILSGPGGAWTSAQGFPASAAGVTAYVPIVFKEYPPIPARPIMLPIENKDGDGDYAVCWGTAPRAQTYELQERWQAGDWMAVYTGSDTETALTQRPAGLYDYRLRGSNTFGDGDWSDIVSTTVQGNVPGTVPRPPANSTNAGGLAVVQVTNDCPYTLRLEFTGPEPNTLSITECAVCHVYSFMGPIFCPTENRPKDTINLAPGTYRVFVSVDAADIGSYVGQWELLGDRRYAMCFFIVRRLATTQETPSAVHNLVGSLELIP